MSWLSVALGAAKEWTLMLDENGAISYYSDCVYSSRRKLFYAVTHHKTAIETWNLRDLSSPKLIKVDDVNIKQSYFTSPFEKLLTFGSVEHLVVAKKDLLYVVQYIMNDVGSDGSCFHLSDRGRPNCYSCPYTTVGFDIFKYDDSKKGKFKYLDSSSLGGLAIFVGKHNHSVAIQVSEFPEVKPDSIYFTDGYYTGKLLGDDDEGFGLIGVTGHDIGIYNYKDKTVSPCYYLCDVRSFKNILPAPICFFPSCTI